MVWCTHYYTTVYIFKIWHMKYAEEFKEG